MKQVTINLDAIAVITVVFMISVGLNLWQRHQFNDLLAEHVDSQWEAQDVKANLVYARRLLKECDPDRYADLDVDG